MQKRHVNIILGVVAVVVVGCVLLVAGGAWFVMSALHRQSADEGVAVAAFEAARTRFKGTAPLFALHPGGAALTRPVPTPGSRTNLKMVHILSWNRDDEVLTQADVPFALLRLKEGPIDVVPYVNVVKGDNPMPRGVSIHVSDIERFGPAMLIDQELEDGGRVLVWTD